MIGVVNKNRLDRTQKADYEIADTNSLFATGVNMIPAPTSVQGPRLLYGNKFFEQALPLENREAPLVRNMRNDTGRSWDWEIGDQLGAIRSQDDEVGAVVEKVEPSRILLRMPDGTKRERELYDSFPGNRKSVTGDTEVFIRRKGNALKLRISEYTEMEGDEVSSYDPATKKSSWQRITGFIRHRNDKKLFRVTFTSGRSVGVTEDHSLLTLGDNGELIPIYPGECVAKVTKCPVVFADPGNADEWTEEQGILDGLFLAEGCYGGKYKTREGAKKRSGFGGPGGLVIAVEPAARKAYVDALILRVTGRTTHKNRKNVTWCDKQLRARWCADFGEYAHGKFISREVFSRGRAYLSGLVAGYFGGDGSVWKDSNGAIQLHAVTVSETLRDDLVAVLNTLGVMCTLTGHPRTRINKAWRDGFGVRPVTSDLAKLDRWFCYEDKEEVLRAMIPDVHCSSRFDYLPVSVKLKALIYETYPRLPTKARRNGFPGSFPKPIYKAVSRGWIDKKLLAPCGGALEAWATSDIRWDTVKKVEPIPYEEEVYDFSVAASEAFALASGLLVHNTLMTSYANVKPGDTITKGQTLASSNFTDTEGRMALGLNARVAVVPYKGYSMDDAIVISQSLANRLSSMHAETVDREHDEDLTLGKSHFISLFPDAYKQDQLDHLDDDGLPVKGQIIQPGDPLVLQTRPRQFNSNSGDVARLSRNKRFVRKDASLKWEGDHPAEILDVAKTKDGGNRILLSYKAPVASGDKLVYRPGAKSTVSLILPDEKMPRTEDGRPVEMLMNQLSLPSRENFETYLELMLGKIARKTGKPYVLPQFLPPGQKWNEFAKAELEKHGLKDAERLYDPEEDIFLDNEVAVGDAFVMKLHHQAANKMTARGQKGYTLDQQPMKGQGQSAQRVSGLEMTALHSSGARGTQQEAILLKGEKRDDYWRALRANRQPAKLDKPFVWDKFLALLQGSGIDPEDRGKGTLRLSPMTRKKLDSLDPLEIQNDGIVDLNTWEPKKGGLFDPQLTMEGRWGFIKLKEPVVNPAYEDTVRTLLGLTKDEYEKLLDPYEP
jgi:hypothetical protein